MVSDRIKEIRSDNGLSQSAFGRKLGVSRDVINNLELGRVEPKESMIKLICYTFQINEDWLMTGHGIKVKVFHEKDKVISSISEKYDLTELETYLVEGYLHLSQNQRQEFISALSAIIDYVSGKQSLVNPQETRSQQEARLLREEADAVERGNGKSSVLPSTKDA